MKTRFASRTAALSFVLLALATGCPSENKPCTGSACPDDAGSGHDSGSNGGHDGGQNNGTDAGPDGSTSGNDSGMSDSGTPDAGQVCTPTGAADEPDVARADLDCDGIDGAIADSIFVAPAPAGDDANPGTMASPVATITHALALAVSSTKHQVLAAEGTYLERVSVVAGVSIHGGYHVASTWTRPAGASTVILGDSPAVVADAITVATRLSMLTIRSSDGVDPSASSIGMIVNASTALALEDVRIEAGNAAAGTAGSTPTRPSQAPGGGMGGNGGWFGCISQAVQSSASGPAGNGASPLGMYPYCNKGGDGQGGTFSQLGGTGGAPSSGSTCTYGPLATPAGANGAPGVRGADGAGGLGIGVVTNTGYMPANGGPGGRGTIGAGGGGGNTGMDSTPLAGSPGWETCSFLGGRGGGGGAGGLGGLGGTAAQGGGASIALIVAASQIQLVRVVLESGNGGRGGDGAAGTLGGLGGTSGPGGLSGGPTNVYAGNPGAPGGAGGDGGSGGGGGGGGGGPSLGLVLVGGAGVQSMALVSIRPGTAGVGGAAGGAANAGETGQVQAVLTVP